VGEGYGSRGLADPALLIGNTDDFGRQAISPLILVWGALDRIPDDHIQDGANQHGTEYKRHCDQDGVQSFTHGSLVVG